MTRFGATALLAGVITLALGLTLSWPALDVLGLGLLVLVVLAFAFVSRRTPLVVERQFAPPYMTKGSPAVAFLRFENRSRRAVAPTFVTQSFAGDRVRVTIPRLRGGERGSRAYRLPTRERGVFDVPPLEIIRSDPFGLFRRARSHAGVERIWVRPRVLPLQALPTGQSRALEGPTSDASPQGSVLFHRLREYSPGDDLRMVHWRSSARTGTLQVRQNVDTAQPFGVVVLDRRPGAYTDASFEDAVDVAASALVACGTGRAPVELRVTGPAGGPGVGGPVAHDLAAYLDHLTGVEREPAGTLAAQLAALRRTRGGTSLVVVTGTLDPADLPHVASLRRRFGRLVVISVDPTGGTSPLPRAAGVRTIVARDADEAATFWNHDAVRNHDAGWTHDAAR